MAKGGLQRRLSTARTHREPSDRRPSYLQIQGPLCQTVESQSPDWHCQSCLLVGGVVSRAAAARQAAGSAAEADDVAGRTGPWYLWLQVQDTLSYLWQESGKPVDCPAPIRSLAIRPYPTDVDQGPSMVYQPWHNRMVGPDSASGL